MVSLILRRVGHEVIHHISGDKALYSAQNVSFNLAILGYNSENKLNLDLARALTLYDATLPLILIAYFIEKQDEIAVAQSPFKAIWGMPLSPERILASVSLYARV